MRKLIAIGCVLALLVPAAALAHNGKHWTVSKAQRVLVNGGIEGDDGDTYYPGRAVCRGYGHTFIASNGNRVFGKFVCALYFTDGCLMIDLWVMNGSNRTWREEHSVDFC